MIVTEIGLENWLCYRGQQVLALEPKAYSIVARRQDEADRSNWQGKSSFVESVLFGLYGQHRKEYEDDWITDGERSGSVRLLLKDGDEPMTVTRSRRRGSPTKLVVQIPGIGEATGDEAQQIICERVGLSLRDFCRGPYVEQKKTSWFVSAKPADRIAIVGEWLRFAPVQEGEKILRAKAAGLADLQDADRSELNRLTGSELKGDPGSDPVEVVQASWQKALEDASRSLDAAARVVLEVSGRRDAAVAARTGQRDLARFREVVDQGTAMATELAAMPSELEVTTAITKAREARDASLAVERTLYQEVRSKDQLSRGKFDGVCPVAGCACPIEKQINADRAGNLKLLEDASARYGVAKKQASDDATTLVRTEAVLRKRDDLKGRIEAHRVEARRLKPIARAAAEREGAVDLTALDDELGSAKIVEAEARERVWQAKQALDGFGERKRRADELVGRIAAREKELATAREALAIFSRGGAQRRIAEGVLGAIQDGANGMLADCGMRLRMEVRWGHEGKGLADSCEACGTPFGRSARVKECARCGTARGHNVEHRLDLKLSDKSGGADDLCGIAFQLSAARWLRRDRSAAWSTCFIDEPFGSLDGANQRSLSAHVASLLSSRYGFRQAFVITHRPETNDAFPGRIEIVGTDRGSTARVIS